MRETYTPFSLNDALVCSAAAAPFRVRWKTPAAITPVHTEHQRPILENVLDKLGLDGRLTDDDEEEQEKEDRADRVKVPDDPVVLSGHVD